MSDTITLRDHDSDGAACKHGYRGSHTLTETPWWCPGGREVTLRAHPVMEWGDSTVEDFGWVEVTDGD